MQKLTTFKTKLCFLGWIMVTPSALMMSGQASAAGTIVFRGLTSGIDSSWSNNTSGTSYTTWVDDGAGFARVNYNTNHDYGLNYKLPDRSRKAIYVKFWVRQNGGIDQGPKNFKVFGQLSNGSQSNTTLGANGSEYDLAYGDSSGGSNDTAVCWRLTGVTYNGTTLTRAAPTVVTKADSPPQISNAWQEWGYYVKFNDDNAQNGEVIVQLNGKEIFHIKNVYNRANGAGPIDNFGVGQFFQPPGGSYSMSRDYRDVRLAYDDWPQSTDINGNFAGAAIAGAATHPPLAPALTVLTVEKK